MMVGDQRAEVLRLKSAAGHAQSALIAIELLVKTGIKQPERCAQSYPHQLSDGQRQRAMIAMALAGHPKLLLATRTPWIALHTIQATGLYKNLTTVDEGICNISVQVHHFN